ncbi:C40 family peptidase [Tropheryma whipplei]|uniref:C40 family peptidase n=1 Tax=Tropheryma whipplei TaxID=2039 RepID=UPI0005A98FD7|nr:C40 family peptidase [Tropheryma whipplei]
MGRCVRRCFIVALVSVLCSSMLFQTSVAADPTGEPVPPGYPNWNDVERARRNQDAKRREVENITGLVMALQDRVNQAVRAAAISAERYQEAKIKLEDASRRSKSFAELAKNSSLKADLSKKEAGRMIANLYKRGSSNMSLFFSRSEDPENLLEMLTLIDRFGGHFDEVYTRAIRDANDSSALRKQADAAHIDFEKLADESQRAYDAAQHARQAAASAVDEQKARSKVLLAQLAVLQNTTQEVQKRYLAGVRERRERAEASRRRAALRDKGNYAAATALLSNNPPRSSAVAKVLNFARRAINLPYVFGGTGNPGYDCSGLTLMAYRAAGINIGSHSVNSQYYTARAKGQLVSYENRQPGDLLFWGSGPGSFYHNGIYVGNGMMIAAPDFGDVVKLQPVWGIPWLQVARPAQ